MNTYSICQSAKDAIKAARGSKSWGRFAAWRFAEKRNILPLYRLACQLEALKGF